MNIYEIRQDMRARHTRISDYKLRVVYYARVSTDKYDQLHSLEAQKTYFENILERNPNWTCVKGYVDEGLTGTKIDKRDSFCKLSLFIYVIFLITSCLLSHSSTK